MRLRSLEIQGFKSFPDRMVLRFGDGITAVVGPNGSGKSNIADAVRWVLGEQSTKTLRGGKMEDVIFGGTQTRKSVGFAKVQLTIDNTDRALPMEEDVVTIARRLYRSGESEYRLNGAMVRLKDIHELFMDTGLGRDGYSIIGQGRIADIVSAKSKQRREIFEEAAGIAKFRYRKEEALRRLAQAEDNLLRLRDILAELEERVGPLRIQAEKAKQYLSLSEEKKSLEISLWMVSLADLKQQLTEQTQRLDLSKQQYGQMENEMTEIEETIAALYMQAQQLSAEIEQKRTDMRTVEASLVQSESDIAILENDIRHNTLSAERLESELAVAGEGAETLYAQIADKQRVFEEGAKILAELQARLSLAEERLQEQRSQSLRVSDELLALTTQQTALSQAVGEASVSKAQNATLLSETENRIQALQQSSYAAAEAVGEMQQNMVECAKQTEEQQEKIDALINTRTGYARKRENQTGKWEELRQKQQQLEQQMQQKRQRAHLLEDLEANMEGYTGSVKYILGQVKKGALRSVFGAVSGLVDTDPQYVLAIETALGAAMQNIVVADESVARQAIQMLQGAKAGRATFLPLTSVRGGRDLDPPEVRQYAGYIGVAAKLVRYDARFAGIISHLLGRVVVVEDLHVGTQIAKATGYRFRIVTLDGQVIHAGGSFTGGSTARSAGVLGRRQEIQTLKQQAALLQTEIEALEPDQKKILQEIAAIDAYLSGVSAEIQTAQEEKIRLVYQEQTLQKDLAQTKNHHLQVQKEQKILQERLTALASSHLSAEQLMDELGAELVQLQTQLDAGAARQNALRIGVETAAGQLAEQRLVHLETSKNQDLLLQEIQQIQAQTALSETRRQQLLAEKEALYKANQAIVEKIEQIRKRKIALQAETQTLTAAIAKLMQQRTALESEITGVRARERVLATEREGVSRELVRLEERQHIIQGEYDGILTKLWDEYELTRSQAALLAQPIEHQEKHMRRLAELRSKIKAIGTVNVDAVEEYAQVRARYEFLTAQLEDVTSSKQQLQGLIQDLTGDMREQFTHYFGQIAEHFSRIFVQLFGGGRAELSLTEGDVLDAGVEINVQPPGKVIKNLSLLSGGEQAFVAIAIYFAILKVRPAPFCLLDEIEAALDDMNVVRFANYLRQMSAATQFIAITHRRGTMEEADVLYGVTMQDEGISKLLELQVSEVESTLGI